MNDKELIYALAAHCSVIQQDLIKRQTLDPDFKITNLTTAITENTTTIDLTTLCTWNGLEVKQRCVYTSTTINAMIGAIRQCITPKLLQRGLIEVKLALKLLWIK